MEFTETEYSVLVIFSSLTYGLYFKDEPYLLVGVNRQAWTKGSISHQRYYFTSKVLTTAFLFSVFDKVLALLEVSTLQQQVQCSAQYPLTIRLHDK